MSSGSPLADVLAGLTREGELYEKLPGHRVRCFACGHRCLIPPGRDGICRVRFNEGGVLKVPFGYVGALQLDPIEKKPFFHALPGARALSFGMLGCDYHCGYCFTGETVVVTNDGPMTFEELFASCSETEERADAELAYPKDRRVIAASGAERRVRGVVRHRYRGALVRLEPMYLPPLRCTPDHRVFATSDPATAPALVAAKDVTRGDYLAVPRQFAFGEPRAVDVAGLLEDVSATYRKAWRFGADVREPIMMASSQGESSRAIGAALRMDPSHVRHVRSRINRGQGEETRTGRATIADGWLRFPGEHAPGIPVSVPLDTDFAALLGYYCAEGCVVRSRRRPNRYVLNFSFSHQEGALAERVVELLDRCLNVKGHLVQRETTIGVACGKTSVAQLFKALAGGRSAQKRVPAPLFGAPVDVVRCFLKAYVEGDGHLYPSGKVTCTTVSPSLATGVAWLALRAGWFPSIYRKDTCGQGSIQGRLVNRSPSQYSVVWYRDSKPSRHVVETPAHYLIPLRSTGLEPYDGAVYNMEVDEEHSYLAGFFGVSNCQNWLTSQALRDPRAVAPPQEAGPPDLVRVALREKARVMTSTYNEPLITSEWAVAVFREARRAGLVCSYVSNGNGTTEVIDYIRPWVSLYKVDLKSFRDRHYRELGGTLEKVLETIRELHAKGFWLEIVTLVIPTFNDSDEELTDIARFLASVSPDIPWHVTAFHKDYKMTGPDNTSVQALLRAAQIGKREGLHFVYAGNIPGRVGDLENTYCPHCRALLIERTGYLVRADRVSRDGRCPDCAKAIPGFWEPAAAALTATT